MGSKVSLRFVLALVTLRVFGRALVMQIPHHMQDLGGWDLAIEAVTGTGFSCFSELICADGQRMRVLL